MAGRSKLRPEDEAAFDRDWCADVDMPTMAARYGMARATVGTVAKRRGLPGRYRKEGRGLIAARTPVDSRGSAGVALTGGRWEPRPNGVQVWVAG